MVMQEVMVQLAKLAVAVNFRAEAGWTGSTGSGAGSDYCYKSKQVVRLQVVQIMTIHSAATNWAGPGSNGVTSHTATTTGGCWNFSIHLYWK